MALTLTSQTHSTCSWVKIKLVFESVLPLSGEQLAVGSCTLVIGKSILLWCKLLVWSFAFGSSMSWCKFVWCSFVVVKSISWCKLEWCIFVATKSISWCKLVWCSFVLVKLVKLVKFVKFVKSISWWILVAWSSFALLCNSGRRSGRIWSFKILIFVCRSH